MKQHVMRNKDSVVLGELVKWSSIVDDYTRNSLRAFVDLGCYVYFNFELQDYAAIPSCAATLIKETSTINEIVAEVGASE